MSRSFRDLLKLSAPVVLSAALLSGCGSGSSGSADLDSGGGPPVTQPPPPVTVTETFDFESTVDWFVVGTAPIHARFSGGKATSTGAGAWIVPSGKTGVVEFGTPASAAKFTTKDNFTPSASSGSGAQKTGVLARSGNEKVDPPFDVPLFVRGLKGDWSANPARQFVEVADNVLEVTLPLDESVVANGEYEGPDEPGEFKVADASWGAVNCGGGDSPRIEVGKTYTLVCGANPGNLDLTITEEADYKFRFDATGADKTAPKLTITKVSGDNGGGGPGPEPDDSTIIRIHTVTVFASAAGPAGVEAVEEIKGLGSVPVDKLFTPGDNRRITKIEIENTGTAGDIGIEDFSWTADARFALATQQVDIFYSRPSGSVAGTKIVVGGQSYDCVSPSPDPAFSCVARNVSVTPFANATMAVQNADGRNESIIFNGGSGADDVYAHSGSAYATTGTPGTPSAVGGARAHLVTDDTLLYDPPAGAARVELLYSPNASIVTTAGGFAGTFSSIPLSSGTNPLPPFNKQLHGLKAWSLGTAAANARNLLRGQLVAVARDPQGRVLAATYVQAAGAIDDVYADAAYGQSLGVTYASGVPSLAVWAPTALTDPGVSVNIYDAAGTMLESRPMTLDPASGIWRITGSASWDRKFYTISLRVYSPHYAANAIVNNEITDPYSVSLSTDSVRSQFVNLDDADLKPAGWDTLQKPDFGMPEDIVIYELHVRDFSVGDPTVPVGDAGKFTAFDVQGTAGRNHLQQLQQAGLTHVHILPAFDIATVKENPDDRVEVGDPVEKLCAAVPAAANLCVTDAGKTIRRAIEDAIAAGWLDRPQQIVNWMRQVDGFNWGYDPFHYGVPEGSYSTNPNGETRIREFRRMVKGLNELGLRTVLDVVYNHTNASGQDPKSVLDKVVPGYYHRRNNTGGDVIGDTCCEDTATEFRMMEKLMIDTGRTWVRDYKVSGFRFDLSGFHTLDNMLRFKSEMEAIDPKVYIYGEAWNYGAVADDGRFTQARQANLGGTGIGSFSDRIRDPIRGGGPFDSGEQYIQNQGFISGWFYDPNAANSGSTAERQALIADTDNIRVWLAAGLETFQFQNAAGSTVTGAGVDYRGQPSGYTEDPSEGINYAEKHDNQTLWDYSSYKHPHGTSLADRVRAHNVGLSLVLLGQGIPFIHAGSEILRSKSGDRDSYDSGDWFNELDWTLGGTKWAQGLPIADKNQGEWPILETKYRVVPRPDAAAQQRAFEHVKEMLQIRKSSELFRLREASQVNLRVKFLNTGPSQTPGMIAMSIDGCTEPNRPAPDRGAYMVIFNASDTPQVLNLFGSEAWTLHPVLANSTDPVVRTAQHGPNGFSVPARTTAVFQRNDQRSCAPFPVDMFVRGSFNDWGNDLNTRPQYKFEFVGGQDYALTGAAVTLPGDGSRPVFKIADANWVAATNCGGTADGQTVFLGLPFTMRCADGTPNLALGVSEPGNYSFSLNAASTVNPVLTVTRTSPSRDKTVFVRGLFGDWGTSRPMAWDGETLYTAAVTATAGPTEFKIATDDWSTLNCGGAPNTSQTVTIGQPLTLACGDGTTNLGITFPPGGGSYVFSVDASNHASLKLTVEPQPVDVFVRGLGGDWSDGAQNRMNYLGSGTYRLDKLVVSGDAFKIASSDWSTVNCGGPANASDNVVIGQTYSLACGDGTTNLGVATTVNGSYRFKYTRGDNKLLVTGP